MASKIIWFFFTFSKGPFPKPSGFSHLQNPMTRMIFYSKMTSERKFLMLILVRRYWFSISPNSGRGMDLAKEKKIFPFLGNKKGLKCSGHYLFSANEGYPNQSQFNFRSVERSFISPKFGWILIFLPNRGRGRGEWFFFPFLELKNSISPGPIRRRGEEGR